MSFERAWDPAVCVIEIPDDDADAAFHFHTRLDAVVVVGDLLRFHGCGRREVETDVELGDNGGDAEFGEGFLLGDLVGKGGCGA